MAGAGIDSDAPHCQTRYFPWAAHTVEQGTADRTKAPPWPKDVWTIRVRLQLEGRQRDLAMFNLAIDSKLRG